MAYSAEQLALQAHIQAQNADAREAGACLLPVDDLDHWASYDIFTIEQYEHYMASAAYIDIYKEINGIKPRWINFDAMSTEEIHAEISSMSKAQMQRQMELREATEKRKQALAHNNRYRPNHALAGLGELLGDKS